jgi:Rieske Fe-S protein
MSAERTPARVDRDCDACPLADAIERRDFLHRATAAALGAVGMLVANGGANRASALPVVFASGMRAGSEKAYAIPATDSVAIDREESVIIARAQGRVYAFSLACPHQNTAIRWEASNKRFQCPKHKSRYRADGTFIEGRATRSLDRFAVKLDTARTQLLVDLDVFYREDRNAAEWKTAFVDVPAS